MNVCVVRMNVCVGCHGWLEHDIIPGGGFTGGGVCRKSDLRCLSNTPVRVMHAQITGAET